MSPYELAIEAYELATGAYEQQCEAKAHADSNHLPKYPEAGGGGGEPEDDLKINEEKARINAEGLVLEAMAHMEAERLVLEETPRIEAERLLLEAMAVALKLCRAVQELGYHPVEADLEAVENAAKVA